MLDNKGHPSRLGIWGWLGGGKWGFERYLYTLHHLTGLGLLLYFLLHIFVSSARAFGSEAWATSMGRVSGPIFVAGEFLVFAAFAFHAANGVRQKCLGEGGTRALFNNDYIHSFLFVNHLL